MNAAWRLIVIEHEHCFATSRLGIVRDWVREASSSARVLQGTVALQVLSEVSLVVISVSVCRVLAESEALVDAVEPERSVEISRAAPAGDEMSEGAPEVPVEHGVNDGIDGG